MALVPIRGPDGMWSLTGVVDDDTVRAPLGRLYWRIGPHFLGIDDSFEEPVIARAYYDPTGDPAVNSLPPKTNFVGYMQFLRVYFNGVPVRPQDYGGHLADRINYVAPDLSFIDFMGPADAAARVDEATRKLNPFYAYNGALRSDYTLAQQFATYPRRNGVLLFDPNRRIPNQARCASLVAELAPGLLTAEHVRDQLRADNLLREVPCEPGDLATQGAYQIALANLRDTGLLSTDVTDAKLAGTALGSYVLIELPGLEGMGSFLCVYSGDDNRSVRIHLLASDEIGSARQSAVMASLLRMAQAIEDDEDEEMVDLTPKPDSRGAGGLETLPFTIGPNVFAVEWRYTTYLVAEVNVRMLRNSDPLSDLRPVHGFTWSVCQKFFPDTRELQFTSIRSPMNAGRFEHEYALRLYVNLVKGYADDPSAAPKIDPTNFTLAGLPLRNLASGRKLIGLTINGQPANGANGAPLT